MAYQGENRIDKVLTDEELRVLSSYAILAEVVPDEVCGVSRKRDKKLSMSCG
jgi:hypothetical protein